MLKIPPFASVLTFGTFFIAMGLVLYRLLWAASQASQFNAAGVLPRNCKAGGAGFTASLRTRSHSERSRPNSKKLLSKTPPI